MVLAEMRPNSTSHRAASDGLRGLHLKRRLELILALLTRPYLRRGAAPKRPAIGILLGPQLGDDRPILRGERCRNSQPRTASRSPSPTSAPADAQKHSSNAEPGPLPHAPCQGPPSPAGNSTTGPTLHAHTTPSFWASSRTQTTTGSEVVLKPCIAENQRPNQVLEKSKDYRIGIRNNGFWYTTKLPESSATKFHSRLSFKNQACGCFIHPALTLLQRHFCLLLCLA